MWSVSQTAISKTKNGLQDSADDVLYEWNLQKKHVSIYLMLHHFTYFKCKGNVMSLSLFFVIYCCKNYKWALHWKTVNNAWRMSEIQITLLGYTMGFETQIQSDVVIITPFNSWSLPEFWHNKVACDRVCLLCVCICPAPPCLAFLLFHTYKPTHLHVKEHECWSEDFLTEFLLLVLFGSALFQQ